jgi:hypothetical protein
LQDVLQRRLVAERGANQVFEFDPDMEYLAALRQYQAEVQRQLQPAGHENKSGQRAQLLIWLGH